MFTCNENCFLIIGGISQKVDPLENNTNSRDPGKCDMR